jgi:hypothetical protein
MAAALPANGLLGTACATAAGCVISREYSERTKRFTPALMALESRARLVVDSIMS